MREERSPSPQNDEIDEDQCERDERRERRRQRRKQAKKYRQKQRRPSYSNSCDTERSREDGELSDASVIEIVDSSDSDTRSSSNDHAKYEGCLDICAIVQK